MADIIIDVTEQVIEVVANNGAYPLPSAINSVFGRIGTIVATEGDYSLTQLSDVTLTSPSNGQVLKYNGTAWINGSESGLVSSVFGRTGAVVATSGDYTTTQVSEGTNLYYTDTRARQSNSFVAGSGAYNSTTGVFTIPTNNNQITNGAGYITLTNLSSTTPLSYNNTTGVFTLSQASASANGFLASGDFNTFNNKQGALTLTTTGTSGAATLVGNTLNIPQYIGGITGTGTTNTLPKFTGTTAIGNSNITDSGTLISLGSDTNISSGALGIGTSALTGYSINIAKNITGATTSYGIRSQGIVQSDVTTLVASYASILNSAAATFTLSDYVHYRSMQGTIGASSVITNQYSYYADSSMTGATNNYAFYSGIASGANRWNLYMQGTAANYLAGVLNIGSTSLAGFQLDVTGTTRLNGQNTITGSTTASGAIARGTNITSTLVAAANSDVLVALDINPTFTNGAFTPVQNYGIRTTGNIKALNFNTVLASNPTQSYITIIGQGLAPNNTASYNILIGGINNGSSRITAQSITSGGDNILIGNGTGSYITTGTNNIGIGSRVLDGNSITQANNTAIGTTSLLNNTGSTNTAIGSLSGLNATSGSGNIFLGYNTGRFQADGSTVLALTGNNNIYIGQAARGFNNSDTNIIVIGSAAIGLGSNTTVIGNSSTTITGLFGNLRLASGMGTAPASATATGTTGDIVVTASAIYVCSATNTWVRALLTTF